MDGTKNQLFTIAQRTADLGSSGLAKNIISNLANEACQSLLYAQSYFGCTSPESLASEDSHDFSGGLKACAAFSKHAGMTLMRQLSKRTCTSSFFVLCCNRTIRTPLPLPLPLPLVTDVADNGSSRWRTAPAGRPLLGKDTPQVTNDMKRAVLNACPTVYLSLRGHEAAHSHQYYF